MKCKLSHYSTESQPIIHTYQHNTNYIDKNLSLCGVCLSCIKVGIKFYRYCICQYKTRFFFLNRQLYTKLNTLHIHTFFTVLMDRFKLILNLCSVNCKDEKKHFLLVFQIVCNKHNIYFVLLRWWLLLGLYIHSYFFYVCTVHLLQFIIQTNKCTTYIRGVTGGTDQTSGGCSLCYTIPI